MNENAVDAKLTSARVARLATRDLKGQPHVVPVCYAYDGRSFYSPVDRKPKRVSAEKLARIRNIRANPDVALLVDHYDEDWDKLWYILVRGRAEILLAGEEQMDALQQLRKKYPQYSSRQLLPEEAPLIRISPVEIISWKQFSEAP
jgi:PPOX class probable F420-dependent enzyme